jgi:hypothetical protein
MQLAVRRYSSNNDGACVTAVIPLQIVTKPAVIGTKPSLTYKSRRKKENRERKWRGKKTRQRGGRR